MRRFAPRLLACALASAQAAQASPFTVPVLLAQERLGAVSFDPSERWLVAPTTAPYASAPRWDLEDYTPMTITRLRVVDVTGKTPPRTLPETVGGPGDWGWTPGPYSPSGARMAVIRARADQMEVGVLDLASGRAVWTGLYPVDGVMGRTLQWRSEDRLLVVAKDPASPSLLGVMGLPVQRRLAERWRATHENRVGVTVSGSGRFMDQTPPPPDNRLVEVEAVSGRVRDLAAGPFFDLEIAPGGRHAALLASGPPLKLDAAMPLHTVEPRTKKRLALVDLDSGERFWPCAGCDVEVDLLAWSPQGRSLIVFARQDGEPWTAGGYRRIDVAARAQTRLSDRAVIPMTQATAWGSRVPRADWMGETPLILARPAGATTDKAPAATTGDWFALGPGGARNLTAGLPPGKRTLAATGPDAIVVGVEGRMWRIDAQGRARPFAKGAAVRATGLPGGDRLTFNQRPPIASLVVAEPGAAGGPIRIRAGTDARAVDVAPAVGETLLASAPGARAIAALGRDAHGVETLTLRRAGAPAATVATLNQGLADIDFATPRPIAHKGPRGEALTSWLYLPPERRPGERLPVVIIPYPGKVYPAPPAGAVPPARQLFLNAQLLAAAGYAVLLPSLPVDETREPAEGLAERLLGVAEAAGAAEPDLDLERLGLWGHSYGGWTVLMAATQSPRFKAVIAGAFAANLASNYARANLFSTLAPDADLGFSADFGWSELGQGRMGVPPWIDPERYARNSPALQADRITAPLLLVMGDLDGAPSEATTMLGAMFRQGKDAQLLTYHGEAHVVMTPANVADLHARILAFLAQTLGPPGSAQAADSRSSQTRAQASR
jgi:dipeptidyl aminopeptidase/acylaminoacyl peptidase